MQADKLVEFVEQQLEDIKARDIVILDVREKASFTDYMVICSGNSSRHVKSIAQSVAIECRAQGNAPIGIEGGDVGEWALVDFGDVVLHVMPDEQRDKYQLEQLWT